MIMLMSRACPRELAGRSVPGGPRRRVVGSLNVVKKAEMP